MPTERFHRLKEEKQQLIANALLEEFERTPYGEICPARIARLAEISRGSLYTYFNGKEDMAMFALYQARKEIWDFNKQALEEEHGDFWKMSQNSLNYQMRRCDQKKHGRLLYGAFVPDVVLGQTGESSDTQEALQQYSDWIFDHMDRSNFRIRTREEFGTLQDMVNSMLAVALQVYLSRLQDWDTVQASFDKKLEQIRKYF